MTDRLIKDRGLLNAYPVQSSVIYKSPIFEGLGLEDSIFSVFLDKKDNQSQDPTILIGHHDHGRSAFKVAQGSFSYYDLKGVGHVVPDLFSKISVGKIKPYNGGFGDQRTFGIFDKENALIEIERIAEWKNKGLKTVPYLLLLELQEIRLGVGYPLSVNTARNEGILNRGDKPVIAVRGWKTPYRLHDLLAKDLTFGEYCEIMDSVKKVLSYDDGSVKEADYLSWLKENLTNSLRILHNNGYVHNDLIPHNVTLDGLILDFDQVKKATNEEIKREKISILKLFSRLEEKIKKF